MKHALHSLLVVLTLASVFASGTSAGETDDKKTNKSTVTGKIQSVVLYRQQALVTRTVPVPAAKENQGRSVGQITVTNLPHSVIPATLFAEGNDNIQIQGVRFETTAVSLSPDPEIKKLQQQIKDLNEQLTKQKALLDLVKQRRNYLDKMEGFVTGTGKVELSKGVLNAETLERMFSFTTKERTQLMEQTLQINKKTQEIQEEINFLKRKQAEKYSAVSKTVRQAIVYYRQAKNQESKIRLSYLVSKCGWSPSYSVRAFDNKEKIDLEYNGMIQQFTGEDWKNVSLTLSTASPAMSAASPGIAPFRISLSSPSPGQSSARFSQGRGPGNVAGRGAAASPNSFYSNEMSQQQIRSIIQAQKGQIISNRNAINYDDNLKSSWAINNSANQLSEIALNLNAEDIESVFSQAIESEESLSLNYELSNNVTLSSRTGQQMVTISKSSLARDLYYVATPILTRQVFREAEIKNTSDNDFLSGPVTVYLDNRYVGLAEMATVARGQSFVVGLGTDPQIRTSRRIVSRTQKTQGGNRVIDLKYMTVVENFKENEVPIRIYDRIPNSKITSQVKVSTHDMKTPLSEDSNYQKIEKPMGILRWDVKIAGGASGEKSFEIPFGYSIEHDRNYMVTTKSKDSDGLKQFDELQRKRSRK